MIMTRTLNTCFFPILLVLLVSFTNAYRLGDVVDTTIRTDGSAEDVLRSQMPLFGRPSNAIFTDTPKRFSLSFEEGLRPIQWVDATDSRGQSLEKLEVTFLFSRSGEGAIHAISSRPTYTGSRAVPGTKKTFLVDYNWVEEEEVNPRAAGAVMLLTVFLACVAILVSSCTSGDSTEGKKHESVNQPDDVGQAYGGYSQPVGVPKWD
jgi:hypothetical protein